MGELVESEQEPSVHWSTVREEVESLLNALDAGETLATLAEFPELPQLLVDVQEQIELLVALEARLATLQGTQENLAVQGVDVEQERKRFEGWATKRGFRMDKRCCRFCPPIEERRFMAKTTQAAWDGWRAAAGALAQKEGEQC